MNDEEMIRTFKGNLVDYISKLKETADKVNQLQSNCETLNNRIKELEQINEEHRKLNGQLRENWNRLREWLEEDLKIIYRDCGHRNNIMRTVLDKMNELEGALNETR